MEYKILRHFLMDAHYIEPIFASGMLIHPPETLQVSRMLSRKKPVGLKCKCYWHCQQRHAFQSLKFTAPVESLKCKHVCILLYFFNLFKSKTNNKNVRKQT